MTRSGAGRGKCRRSAILLALIVAVYMGLASLYVLFIPPFEGPDEPQHFAYVTWLIRTNTLPPTGEQAFEAGIEHEASQHPFYYLIASLPGRLVELDNPPVVYRPNPHFIGPLARNYPDNDNRAIHYEGDAQPLRGGWLAFYGARAVTMLFGSLLIVAVHGLARQIWPGKPLLALQGAALIAVIPQILFLGAVVSNDVPVAALSACTLWVLALLLRRGPGLRRAILLGAVFGLAALTKTSALALAVPLSLGLLWQKQRYRQSSAQFASMVLAAAGTALLVCGWWFARSWMLYGSPFGLETHAATTWAIVDPADVELAWRRWWEVFRSLWLWFGWGTVRAADGFYYLMGALTLLALAGIARRAQRWLALRTRQDGVPGTGAVLLTLSAVAVLAVALVLELWMRQVIAPFGRLLFPALSAIVVLLIAGWHALHPRLPLLVTALLLVVAILSPWMILQPAYARPQRLSASDVEASGAAAGLRFGATFDEAFAEILSMEALQKSVPAGDVAPVRVCWRALQPAQRDYSLLLQIIGPNDRRIAGRSTYPGLGAYPTSQWQAGDLFCDRVQIEIPSQPAIEPLVYQLEVAMIDSQSNRRLSIFDETGTSWPVAFVDRIHVYSEALVEKAPPELLEVNPPPLTLIDYSLPQRRWRTEESFGFTLHWTTTASLPADYQTFVHLRAPDAPEPVAQADGPPLDGWYPTSWWPVGEIVSDARRFSLPENTPAGEYHLYVGMYDLSDNRRVTSEYDLGPITVEP